jgi:histidinol-phosphate aminotransferase
MLTRRTALKSTILALGGTHLLPYLSPGERLPDVPLVEGRLRYSPFYEEYVPPAHWFEKPLRARLNANENPYGPSPAAIAAVKDNAEKGNLYGWDGIKELTAAIAQREGLEPDQVLIGPGSTDFLEKSGMLFFERGGELVSADPTFMTIIRTAQAVGAKWRAVPLKADWSHDLDAMEAAITDKTRMVYVCNPNNPTGTLTNAEALLDFGRKVSSRVPVFADEAYMDFLDTGARSYNELIRDGHNVLVARTFSKIHGLAGMRIGYLLGQTETLKKISRCSFTGMGISNTSVAAALASLNDDQFIKSCREKNAEARQITFDGLTSMGYKPVPSYTSFMIFPIREAGPLFSEKLHAQGIGIRTLKINGKDWCRVSIGNKESMNIFLDGVKSI